jgi:hypothetical protein
MGKTIFAACHRHFPGALCTGLFLSIISTAAMADPRCQQLEALHRQYIGVTLTSEQQQLKRRLVAWYNANCRSRRASR